MTKSVSNAFPSLGRMSALKIATLANVAIILLAEAIAVAAWYTLYGVFGPAVMVTAAITLIASALPLVTLGIYVMKRLDETNRELAASKLELKQRATEALRSKDAQLADASIQLTRAQEDIETANHNTAHCLALVSHELRTPLNAIIGCSEAMQKQTFGPIGSAKYHEFTENIHKSGQYLLAVINDVLELSKAEGGAEQLNEEMIDVPAFLQEVETLVGEICDRYEIELSISCADDVGNLVADPVKLKQILVNLITNAIKYTPAGGTCRLEVGSNDAGEFTFDVIDSGHSVLQNSTESEMAAADNDPMALTPASAGLGLPLSEALAELHGGKLEMIREQGGGSRVVVHLPASRRLADGDLDGWQMSAAG